MRSFAILVVTTLASRVASADDEPQEDASEATAESDANGNDGEVRPRPRKQIPPCFAMQATSGGVDLTFAIAGTTLRLSGADWQLRCDAAQTLHASSPGYRVVVPVARCSGVGEDGAAYVRSRAKQEFEATELKSARVEVGASADKDPWKATVHYVSVSDSGATVGTFATRHSRAGCAADLLIVTKGATEAVARKLAEQVTRSFALTFDAPHSNASTEARTMFRCSDATVDRPYCSALDRFDKLGPAFVAKPERAIGRVFRYVATAPTPVVEHVGYVDVQQGGASMVTLLPTTPEEDALHRQFLSELRKSTKGSFELKLPAHFGAAQIPVLPIVSANKDGTLVRTREGFALIRGGNDEFVALDFGATGKLIGIAILPRGRLDLP